MSLEKLVLAGSIESFNSAKPAAIKQLSDVFSPDEWGFDIECVEYSTINIDNLWTNQVRRGLVALLAAAGKSVEDYRQFLGAVHFTSVAVYPKRLFPKYKRNEGWRILLLGVPAARVLIAGLESNYQGGQRHNQTAVASNVLLTLARAALSSSKLALPGRELESADWDATGLILSPVTEVAGVDIAATFPDGIQLKEVRTTTVKKIIASFIGVNCVLPSEALEKLAEIRPAASLLATELHPFCDIGAFEQFRKLAFEDPAAARIRFELRRRSNSRSIVRVYYGPPGTGKTLAAVMDAVLMADPAYRDKNDYEKAFARFNDLHGQVAFVTFHQSLQYEDMIESIRPQTASVVAGDDPPSEDDSSLGAGITGGSEQGSSLSYHLHHGPILQIIRRAALHPEQEHVLVIDEINRGDLSRILGPLISSIEPDKRVGAEFPIGFEAQYSGKPELESRIFMPSNLHILGTMNSADRNIALVDYALRRRFDFVECPPRPELLPATEDPHSIDTRRLLEVLNRRIRYLLDRDHCIGHGYLMGCKSKSDVIQAFARRILPLLNEYFFGNEGNLLLVVGDRINGEHNIFKIERREEAFGRLFGVEVDQAAELGYREHEAHVSISVDRRFWNPDQLIPGPEDDTYALAALRKIYLPNP